MSMERGASYTRSKPQAELWVIQKKKVQVLPLGGLFLKERVFLLVL